MQVTFKKWKHEIKYFCIGGKHIRWGHIRQLKVNEIYVKIFQRYIIYFCDSLQRMTNKVFSWIERKAIRIVCCDVIDSFN